MLKFLNTIHLKFLLKIKVKRSLYDEMQIASSVME